MLCVVKLKRVHVRLCACRKPSVRILTLFLKKFRPRYLDNFSFSPSVGASGGVITILNSSVLDGTTIQSNAYAITVKFHNRLDNKDFHLTNIYGPSAKKMAFVTWLINLDISNFDDRLLASDFNLIRSSENRNKPGGDLGDFNDCILGLDLVEIPFNGRNFTWSNMQSDPLLVKLDWVFSSVSWNLSYRGTVVQTLARPISDHIPFVIYIDSCIPKAIFFRFENFWI